MRRFLLPLLLGLLLGASPAVQQDIERGEAAFARADYANALVHWSTALKTAREEKDAESELDLLHRLAATNRELGRLDPALELLDLAKPLAKTAAQQARQDADRGMIAYARGRLDKAETLLGSAFGAYQGAEAPRGAANTALNLGVVRTARADLAGAEKAYGAAKTLFAALEDGVGEADAAYGLARVAWRTGAVGTAEAHVEEAMALYRREGQESGEADALVLQGLVLQDLGHAERAEALLDEALQAARKRKDVARQATILDLLGTLAATRQDAATAVRRYAAAEEAWLKLGRGRDAAAVALNRAMVSGGKAEDLDRVRKQAKKAGDLRLEAIASLNLADRLIDDDPAAASKHVERAAELADTLELSAVRWRARYLLGRAEQARGKTKAAIEAFERAVDELERTRSTLDKAEAERFVSGHDAVYQSLIDLLLSEGRSLDAFAYAQRLQLSTLPSPTEGPAAELDALAQREAHLAASLADEVQAGRDDTAKDLREQLAALRVEFADTVDTLRATYPDFDSVVRVDPEDLEAIQAELDPGVVVLQPVLLPDRTVLMVFSRDRLEPVEVDIPGPDVVRTLRRLTRFMQSANTYDPDTVNRLAEALGTWLWAPVAEQLKDAEVVVVSATGPLRELPFSMLRYEGEFLVQHAAVASITHVGSLRRRAAGTRLHLEPDSLLLVGNPDGSLPGAEEEVAAIHEWFPKSATLLGVQGTRDAVMSAVEGKRAIHLATHGIIDPNQPNASYLVLAEDARIPYREIPGLGPWLEDCRLVVLSACESGRPVEARDDVDESGAVVVSINGLAAQFRRAGVETLVGSLWKVDDEGTTLLMEGFYRELAKGTDVARSMQSAQLKLLEEEAWQHPFYWSAFVVVGDWR